MTTSRITSAHPEDLNAAPERDGQIPFVGWTFLNYGRDCSGQFGLYLYPDGGLLYYPTPSRPTLEKIHRGQNATVNKVLELARPIAERIGLTIRLLPVRPTGAPGRPKGFRPFHALGFLRNDRPRKIGSGWQTDWPG